MLVYLGLFTPALLLILMSQRRLGLKRMNGESSEENKPNKFFFCLSGIWLTCVLGLREGVGTDYYEVYARGYTSALNGSSSRYEAGFALLQKLCSLVTEDYHLLFFASAAITVALVYYAIYRWSKMPLLSVVVFLFCGLFFFATNAVRQAIAIALFLNAIPYAIKGKPLYYCVLILIAACFHKSAIVLLVLYFARYIKLNFVTGILACVAVTALGEYLVTVSLQFGSLISEQFSVYSRLEQYLEGNLDLLDLGYIVISFVLFLFVRKKQKNLYSDSIEIRVYLNILFAGLLVIIMTGHMFILFRIARYFTPVLIFFVPALIAQLQSRKRKKAVALLIVICFIAASFVAYGYLEMDQAVPYRTFLIE